MEIRVDLASRFISALICRDPKRSIESRLSEVRHALLLADVLLAIAAQDQGCSIEVGLQPNVLMSMKEADSQPAPSRNKSNRRHVSRTSRIVSDPESNDSPTLH